LGLGALETFYYKQMASSAYKPFSFCPGLRLATAEIDSVAEISQYNLHDRRERINMFDLEEGGFVLDPG